MPKLDKARRRDAQRQKSLPTRERPARIHQLRRSGRMRLAAAYRGA